MALSASGTKRDETKKDTKRTCRKHQKIIDKERINICRFVVFFLEERRRERRRLRKDRKNFLGIALFY